MWAGVYAHHRPGDGIQGAINASGVFVDAIGPCPEGWQWHVERMTCWSNTSDTDGVLEVFVLTTNKAPTSPDKRGRQDVATGTVVAEGVSDEKSPIVVPAGYFLVASWSALTSGDLVALTFQIRLHDLRPAGAAPRHRNLPLHQELVAGHDGA